MGNEEFKEWMNADVWRKKEAGSVPKVDFVDMQKHPEDWIIIDEVTYNDPEVYERLLKNKKTGYEVKVLGVEMIVFLTAHKMMVSRGALTTDKANGAPFCFSTL